MGYRRHCWVDAAAFKRDPAEGCLVHGIQLVKEGVFDEQGLAEVMIRKPVTYPGRTIEQSRIISGNCRRRWL